MIHQETFLKRISLVKKTAKAIRNTVNNIITISSVTTTITKSKNVNLIKTGNNNKLPTIDDPNSTKEKPNGDIREYGPDGKAKRDIDISHPLHHPKLPNPHAHDWTWEGNKPTRGPAIDPKNSAIILGGVAALGGGYLIYRGIRMLPSLLPWFWWTIPYNVVTP